MTVGLEKKDRRGQGEPENAHERQGERSEPLRKKIQVNTYMIRSRIFGSCYIRPRGRGACNGQRG